MSKHKDVIGGISEVMLPERKIKIDQVYHLHASNGYQGLVSGMIVITGIYEADDEAIYESDVVPWIEAIGLSGEEPDRDEQEEIAECNTVWWVQFAYCNREEHGYVAMPLPVFANHITVY